MTYKNISSEIQTEIETELAPEAIETEGYMPTLSEQLEDWEANFCGEWWAEELSASERNATTNEDEWVSGLRYN